MKIHHLLIILGVVIAIPTTAQNILTSTIEWNCNATFVAHPGIITEEITKVVSSQETIVWYDNNGATRQALSIVGSVGSWSNVTHEGIALTVAWDNGRGVVQFTRSDGKASIQIHLTGENETQLYELTVDSLDTL